LRAQDFTWDEAQLDKWLSPPQADIPGLCLPFNGLAKAEQRRAFITHLKHPRREAGRGASCLNSVRHSGSPGPTSWC